MHFRRQDVQSRLFTPDFHTSSKIQSPLKKRKARPQTTGHPSPFPLSYLELFSESARIFPRQHQLSAEIVNPFSQPLHLWCPESKTPCPGRGKGGQGRGYRSTIIRLRVMLSTAACACVIFDRERHPMAEKFAPRAYTSHADRCLKARTASLPQGSTRALTYVHTPTLGRSGVTELRILSLIPSADFHPNVAPPRVRRRLTAETTQTYNNHKPHSSNGCCSHAYPHRSSADVCSMHASTISASQPLRCAGHKERAEFKHSNTMHFGCKPS